MSITEMYQELNRSKPAYQQPYHFCISCGTGIHKDQAVYAVKRRGRILCVACLEALGAPEVDPFTGNEELIG